MRTNWIGSVGVTSAQTPLTTTNVAQKEVLASMPKACPVLVVGTWDFLYYMIGHPGLKCWMAKTKLIFVFFPPLRLNSSGQRTKLGRAKKKKKKNFP